MGFGDWAKKHLAVRFDSHTLGNLTKNAAPVAGAVLGGPAGLALAGGLSTAGDLSRGKNIGEAVKGGVKNAALAASLNAGAGALKTVMTKGASTAAGGAGSAVSGGAANTASAIPSAVPTGGLTLPSVPSLTSVATKAVDPRNFAEKGFDAVKGVGSWALDHPNAAAGALNAVGGLATAGTANRQNEAETDLLHQQHDVSSYDLEQRKREDEERRQRQMALSPVWSALGSSVGNYGAKNPYTSGG